MIISPWKTIIISSTCVHQKESQEKEKESAKEIKRKAESKPEKDRKTEIKKEKISEKKKRDTN